MKTRDFRTRHAGRYGETWERVRRFPCFWLRIDPTHVCGLGQTGGHTAHHYIPVGRGGRDRDGLLPACGQIHDKLHGWGQRNPAEALSAMKDRVQEVLKCSLAEVAKAYTTHDPELSYDLDF